MCTPCEIKGQYCAPHKSHAEPGDLKCRAEREKEEKARAKKAEKKTK